MKLRDQNSHDQSIEKSLEEFQMNMLKKKKKADSLCNCGECYAVHGLVFYVSMNPCHGVDAYI